MDNTTLILIAAAVLIAACLGIWFFARSRRSQMLREKFGPEYNYTLEKVGDKHTAEAALKEREERVIKLDIHDLDENQKDRYQKEWITIQADFVDDPSKSVQEANRLITEVMIARGFPVADFDQRAADLSVMFSDFVLNYRNAQAIAQKNAQNQTSTEELRQAMVHYHTLYGELLGTVKGNDVESKEKEDVGK
jgi:hypothetical protein